MLRGERAEERRASVRKMAALDAVVEKLRKELVAANKAAKPKPRKRLVNRVQPAKSAVALR